MTAFQQNITILGSTGSIGTSTLDVLVGAAKPLILLGNGARSACQQSCADVAQRLISMR